MTRVKVIGIAAAALALGASTQGADADAHASYDVDSAYKNRQTLIARNAYGRNAYCEIINGGEHLRCRALERGVLVTMIHHRIASNRVRCAFFVKGRLVDERFWRYYR